MFHSRISLAARPTTFPVGQSHSLQAAHGRLALDHRERRGSNGGRKIFSRFENTAAGARQAAA